MYHQGRGQRGWGVTNQNSAWQSLLQSAGTPPLHQISRGEILVMVNYRVRNHLSQHITNSLYTYHSYICVRLLLNKSRVLHKLLKDSIGSLFLLFLMCVAAFQDSVANAGLALWQQPCHQITGEIWAHQVLLLCQPNHQINGKTSCGTTVSFDFSKVQLFLAMFSCSDSQTNKSMVESFTTQSNCCIYQINSFHLARAVKNVKPTDSRDSL